MTVNKRGHKFTICTECPYHHIDNCITCFGFGIKKRYISDGINIPVISSESIDFNEGRLIEDWIKCPECESTPYGVNNDN